MRFPIPKLIVAVLLAASLILLAIDLNGGFSHDDPEPPVVVNPDGPPVPEPKPHPTPLPPIPVPIPVPRPKPVVVPQGEDYPSAFARSQITGRPLFVLVGAPWCRACVYLESEERGYLKAMRARGELARIDWDRENALALSFGSNRRYAIPRLVVYERRGGEWSKAADLTGYVEIGNYLGLDDTGAARP